MSVTVWLAGVATQIAEARISWRYGAEAVFFLGVAYGLMRWIGRTLRELAGAESYDRAPGTGEEREQAAGHGARGLVAAGVVSALPNSGRESAVHVLAHCPACGLALTSAPQPLPFAVTCEGCGRRIYVRGDGPGRMSVVVSGE